MVIISFEVEYKIMTQKLTEKLRQEEKGKS